MCDSVRIVTIFTMLQNSSRFVLCGFDYRCAVMDELCAINNKKYSWYCNWLNQIIKVVLCDFSIGMCGYGNGLAFMSSDIGILII